ncbi:hypothetical protein M0813_24166 [Anaeramoeba flamelloides]|uniref:Uncharacterized protein n=1 Tax=Anaeramoeba flamelloides TaxID=1746091 RepID=A0ABQ8Y8A4_9EUKA|nr:hypothetical protein M0813_24166 [Anaeramoeba flamelloides]
MINSDQMTMLTKRFGELRSMNDRLFLFLQFFPNSIKGLKLEDLQIPKQKNVSCSEFFNVNNTPDQKNNLNPKQNPKKIVIIRSSLTTMSGLTGVSRRSLERGLSNFFERNYSLHNISPYSKEYLTFGETDKLTTKKIRIGTKKNKSKKKKIIRVKKELILNQKAKKTKKKIKTQPNTSVTSNSVISKKLTNTQNNVLGNRLPKNKNDMKNLIVKNNDLQKNVCRLNNKKFSQIPRKRNFTFQGNYYLDQENQYISIKSPLHLLSVISQTHKKPRSNSLLQNMKSTLKNNDNYQQNNQIEF